MNGRRDLAQLRRVRLFLVVVRQRNEIDLAAPCQLIEDVVRANPIAAVRRVWKAMSEE
jgi:hypothetical protein